MLNFAGKIALAEELGLFQLAVQVEEIRLDYCATLNAQLDTNERALIAIKIVLVDGPIKGSSVDWLNMVEEEVMVGILVMVSMIME